MYVNLYCTHLSPSNLYVNSYEILDAETTQTVVAYLTNKYSYTYYTSSTMLKLICVLWFKLKYSNIAQR
jgi:hypothetical protein